MTNAQLFVSDPIVVSEEGTGKRAPRIALLEDDRPVVYWGKTGSNPLLYTAQWNNVSFGQSMIVDTDGIEPDLWGGGLGPSIAAHGNTVFLVFENYGEGIYCLKSIDGGDNFGEPVDVFIAPPGRVATLPSLVIDPNGNPIISFVTTNSSEQEAQYETVKSLDGGDTFELPVVANVAASGSEVCECCPASMGVTDEDEVFLTFRNNDNNLRDIWVAKSSDAGASFTEAADIDETDWEIQSCPQSGPDMMISGDQLAATFFNGADGSKVYFSSVNKNTMELEQHFHIPPIVENKNQNYPAIAGNGDTLAVIWQESGQLGLDIMMAWTTTGAADLLNNTMVITDDLLSERQPDMVFKNGRFHIVYEDQNTGQVLYKMVGFDPSVDATQINLESINAKIQPNPFSEKTKVYFENSTNEKTVISLWDINGQLLKKEDTTSNSIEISALDAGIYVVKIQQGKFVEMQKLIAQ
ncbi:MAG: hypothetical protein ACJAYJ_000087 [Saprospiraceae bacterium]|jgi:hypothetical protein